MRIKSLRPTKATTTSTDLTRIRRTPCVRCCLGSTELFTPMGIGTTIEPYRGAHGLDLSLDPALDEIVSVRDAQAAELEPGLDEVTAVQLAARAPVPDDDAWPPYARGRSVRQCLGTVLNETFGTTASASATST